MLKVSLMFVGLTWNQTAVLQRDHFLAPGKETSRKLGKDAWFLDKQKTFPLVLRY